MPEHDALDNLPNSVCAEFQHGHLAEWIRGTGWAFLSALFCLNPERHLTQRGIRGTDPL
jgi:hypothetical protein